MNNQVSQVPQSEVLTCADAKVFGLGIFAFAHVPPLSTFFTTASNADSF